MRAVGDIADWNSIDFTAATKLFEINSWTSAPHVLLIIMDSF